MLLDNLCMLDDNLPTWVVTQNPRRRLPFAKQASLNRPARIPSSRSSPSKPPPSFQKIKKRTRTWPDFSSHVRARSIEQTACPRISGPSSDQAAAGSPLQVARRSAETESNTRGRQPFESPRNRRALL